LVFITKDINIGFYFNGNLGMLKNVLFSEANLKTLVPTLYYINFFKPILCNSVENSGGYSYEGGIN
jgi:hypothetical protein